MKYQDWLHQVPDEIKNDSVWNLKVYRAALFLTDLCWSNTTLILEKRFFSLADQLYSSTGSVSANILKVIQEIHLRKKLDFMNMLWDLPGRVKIGILKADMLLEINGRYTE